MNLVFQTDNILLIHSHLQNPVQDWKTPGPRWRLKDSFRWHPEQKSLWHVRRGTSCLETTSSLVLWRTSLHSSNRNLSVRQVSWILVSSFNSFDKTFTLLIKGMFPVHTDLSYIYSRSEKCSDLLNVVNLVTGTAFPVDYGALVTVSCAAGFTLEGDQVITCNKDAQFLFKTSPSCIKSGL